MNAEDPNLIDLETRVTDQHHGALRLWLRILSTSNRVEGEIRNRLRDAFGISLSRFDLMAQLERHPEGLLMGELSKRMMVSGGNITGITDQLQAEGLVERLTPPNDRRSYLVRLTPAGRRSFKRMSIEHERWIAEVFGDINEDEMSTTLAVLERVKRTVIAPPEPEQRPSRRKRA